MEKFNYYVPTKIIFGKDTEFWTGTELRKSGAKKVLIVYGGKSAQESGLLDRIKKSLEEEKILYAEWGGVKPNPRLSHAEAGTELAIRENVDFVLAVGGGSVIDTAKAISHGAANAGTKLWDIWTGKARLEKSLPVGAVLTIAAAGSETSDSAVLTNTEIGKKAGLSTSFNRPVFAIMNPELTYTLPKYQIACGIADIMMHTLERYFIPDQKNQMTDEIAEGLLRTVIANGRTAVKNPRDYDAMSEIMWCGSLSHNDLTGLGRKKDFSVHKLGHALGARFDCAHGASLAAVWGAWAEYVYQNDIDRFYHYGEKVWGLCTEDKEQTARQAIRHTVDYFREIGMPTNLTELGIGVQEDAVLKELAMDATKEDTVALSFIRKLKAEDVYQIFKTANK
ncbi:MAG: iron-containing alcohol dehydrogenase [Eubacterium sp.]|jgi:Uncharacterized oxidoreductases, Fe-dependent alcohol dehydrogenase family|nr:iron-containing alcohol dehydrogenase [Eubacterium sp.]